MKKVKARVTGYQKSFEKYGVSPKSLKWASKRAAKQRYEQIVADIDFEGKSILDVGCGFGDIIPRISAKAKRFDYTGIDVTPEFIGEAKKLYFGHKFIVGNYFAKPLKENFDVVISSGALNLNVRDNLDFRKKAIKTMFKHAKEVFVFNMAGRYPQPKTSSKSNVWFANPLEILEYCLGLTKKVILRHHYHSRDFTIVMFK